MAKELLEKPYYSADQTTEGAVGFDDVLNCYFEPIAGGKLTLRRRPVLDSVFCTLSGTSSFGVAGIYWWERANVFLAVYGTNLFVVSQAGVVTDQGVWFSGNVSRAVFSEGETAGGVTWVYIVGGAGYPTRITHTTSGGFSIFSVATVTPGGGQLFDALTIAYINRRFVAPQPNSARFYFTDTNPSTGILENDYWDSSDNPLVAESDGDRIIAITTHLNEIYVWGTKSVEIWQDDGVTPFVPVQGASINFGIQNREAITIIGDRVFAAGVLNGVFCVAELTGRQARVISDDIKTLIGTPFTVPYLLSLQIGKQTFLLVQFGYGSATIETWAFDINTGYWSKWTDFNDPTHSPFIGKSSAINSVAGISLVGANTDGRIFRVRFGPTYHRELGHSLEVLRRTPWIQHGTWKRKRCNAVYLRLKRGHTADGRVFLRWADDGRDTWSPSYQLNLFPTSNKDFISRNRRMGIYHSRRYEFTMSDNADFVLSGSEEDVTVLRD